MAATRTWAGAKAAAASEHEASFWTQLALLLVLNLADALFTLVFLQLHLAEEANPLMRAAYAGSPALFLATKLTLVHSGALLLWINRAYSVARIALGAAVCLYSVIVVYHCSFAAWLLVGLAR